MENVIREEVIMLADTELEAGINKFGHNNSNHEAYAVLLEEIEEAKSEIHVLEIGQKFIWEDIKRNAKPEDLQKDYKKVYKTAINLAIEAIQCAAMARKGFIYNKQLSEGEEKC